MIGPRLRRAAFAAPMMFAAMPALAAPVEGALGRLLAERLRHMRIGLIAARWVALLLPRAAAFGPGAAARLAWHAVLLGYLPFVTLIFALCHCPRRHHGVGRPLAGPVGNTLPPATGTDLASPIGRTGAAMVLIHPLLRANAHRRRKVQRVLFFILLVANLGGAPDAAGRPTVLPRLHGWRCGLIMGPLPCVTLLFFRQGWRRTGAAGDLCRLPPTRRDDTLCLSPTPQDRN